jgi:trans-aconitate methyltransferase
MPLAVTNAEACKSIPKRYSNRFHRDYAASKLRLDPVYDAAAHVLQETELPTLDLGCGIGLLAQYLNTRGIKTPIHGLDFDAGKIASATTATSHQAQLSFSVADLRQPWPEQQGNVTLLDVLQYLAPTERAALLERSAQGIAPGGILIIRTGLISQGWRFRTTKLIDFLAKRLFWMKSGPISYPTEAELVTLLQAQGLTLLSKEPLNGKMPFNNYLFVFRRK